jgi:peptidyl-prolyl cis-trans isomerase C
MTTRRKPVLFLALTFTALAAFAGCKKGAEVKPEESKQNAPAAAPGQTTPGQTAPGQPAQAAAPGGMPPAGMPPAGLPSHNPAAETPVDPSKMPDVVARINGEEIKKAQLVKDATNAQMRFAQMQGIQPPLTANFYKQVLDDLIARTLLTQEAKEQKVTVTDAEVERELGNLRSQAPNPEEFKKALAANGMTEETLRQRIRHEGAVQKFVQTKVLAGVTVSDQAAKEFYDKNPDKMKKPERAHVRHILIHTEANAPAADKEKARAKAEDLLKRLQKGEDFGKLATENSDDPGSKTRGGDLGWFSHGQMVPAFDKAAFALVNPNDLSPVVETQFGYHIIQLVGKEGATVAPFDMVKPQIVEFLKRQQMEQVLAAHVQQLRTKGKVETFI